MTGERQIAVALHHIEPATFERCALMRDWLDDHGIDKVTLLVVPAGDLHPFHDRSPELAAWVNDRVARGDAVAQHGFQHRRLRPPSGLRRAAAAAVATGGRAGVASGHAEFLGLDDTEARRAVAAGRRVLKLAGITPRGFVAPAYAYTAGLERAIAPRYDWWASLHRLFTDHGRRSSYVPAMTISAGGSRTIAGRLASPWGVRASALMAGPLLRLDLHPADLDQRGRIAAAEQVLRRAGHRTPVTYDELASRPS